MNSFRGNLGFSYARSFYGWLSVMRGVGCALISFISTVVIVYYYNIMESNWWSKFFQGIVFSLIFTIYRGGWLRSYQVNKIDNVNLNKERSYNSKLEQRTGVMFWIGMVGKILMQVFVIVIIVVLLGLFIEEFNTMYCVCKARG
jgi:accessory gene regulator protein AgrB